MSIQYYVKTIALLIFIVSLFANTEAKRRVTGARVINLLN